MILPTANIYDLIPRSKELKQCTKHISGIRIPEDCVADLLFPLVDWFNDDGTIRFVTYNNICIIADEPFCICASTAPYYERSTLTIPLNLRELLREYEDKTDTKSSIIAFVRCLFERSQITICGYPIALDINGCAWIILEERSDATVPGIPLDVLKQQFLRIHDERDMRPCEKQYEITEDNLHLEIIINVWERSS